MHLKFGITVYLFAYDLAGSNLSSEYFLMSVSMTESLSSSGGINQTFCQPIGREDSSCDVMKYHFPRTKRSQTRYTDKKRKSNFPHTVYKEIQSGAVATSYKRKSFLIFEEELPNVRKCANISPYMRRPLVICDFTSAPFWISLL